MIRGNRLSGFPRPRGDGPHRTGVKWPTGTVSPPTRGWTVIPIPVPSALGGFPAHAGMDRMVALRADGGSGFPRPRGDGPRDVAMIAEAWKVSPPTRGWTVVDSVVCRIRRGFPAHAGMDPTTLEDERTIMGFPRPRGDGPSGGVDGGSGSPVSPPTRGWTRGSQPVNLRTIGFPAHAGMDPLGLLRPRAAGRFPRPRGDGPRTPCRRRRNHRVSPPTRGWTAELAAGRRPRCGFPAHAGMDPSRWRCSQATPRFPRPRGDGPSGRRSRRAGREVSPPTRGWTPDVYSAADRWQGFPAHAGMDPSTQSLRVDATWFPRPRGDGPALQTVAWDSAAVSPPTRGWTPGSPTTHRRGTGFPAHAGMDRASTRGGAPRRRFPRPRGDGPTLDDKLSRAYLVSPPTRGWTSLPAGAAVVASVSPPTRGWTADEDVAVIERIGFPAHAGMDPDSTVLTPDRGRFPRPRGDGPSS